MKNYPEKGHLHLYSIIYFKKSASHDSVVVLILFSRIVSYIYISRCGVVQVPVFISKYKARDPIIFGLHFSIATANSIFTPKGERTVGLKNINENFYINLSD